MRARRQRREWSDKTFCPSLSTSGAVRKFGRCLIYLPHHKVPQKVCLGLHQLIWLHHASSAYILHNAYPRPSSASSVLQEKYDSLWVRLQNIIWMIEWNEMKWNEWNEWMKWNEWNEMNEMKWNEWNENEWNAWMKWMHEWNEWME